MYTKICQSCWKKIPVGASVCPYCLSKQYDASPDDYKWGGYFLLILGIGCYIGSVFAYFNPIQRSHINPEWNPWYGSGNQWIYELDYMWFWLLIIGGSIFILVALLFFWISKD